MRCSARVLSLIPSQCSSRSHPHYKPPRRNRPAGFSSVASRSPPREAAMGESGTVIISLNEWQSWGTNTPVPAMVTEIVEELKALEKDTEAPVRFGGLGGKLKGDFKVVEDKKHRAKYETLSDSEEKLRFFSARQVACRLLGSSGYLCQKCWLPEGDCMCSRIKPCLLWPGIRFWLYMHPKDFLRQNNTGKLLWQLFGKEAATLCIYGIAEQEEMMWNSFKLSGRSKVWCLYPNKNAPIKSVKDTFPSDSSNDHEFVPVVRNGDEVMNFILIDGTWSNSAAMFRRLKERAESVWGEELSCISLTTGASTMHRLRPQPSWDRTCTAAAAIGLLTELQLLPQYRSCGLDKSADAMDEGLESLLEALTTRRLRMGRSIRRTPKHKNDIC
uniref:tRNA-uridine aminocarboxypropyltransferase n=1 Tax=Kalanchoe fedtschenkoi TaxID=63787 RepID=A0A7N0U3A2_KALFE